MGEDGLPDENPISDAEVEGDAKNSTEEQPSYSWPVDHFKLPPYRTYHFFNQFRRPSNPNNFLKGVKWSPDGSCFLTCSEDKAFRIFTLPSDDSCSNVSDCSLAADTAFISSYCKLLPDSYDAKLVIVESEGVYDFCWYPFMSTSYPDTCVFASTTRDLPIRLWDASSGQLRCTYRAYDAMDEITASYSLSFNPSGAKIFAGYNKCIRIFDIHRPGRDYTQHATLKENKEGQAGIISSFAFSPSYSGILAAGSYDKTTAIYREDNMELLYVLHGQEGGVTHVQFSKDGNYLYTGGRKDQYILCWDIRKTVETVYKLYRSTETTNQRIQFDIDPTGQYLAAGGQDGSVHFYNLQNGQWLSSFQAASDTINGFSFHPFFPMAATSSGQRRFARFDDDSDSDSSPREPILGGNENCVSVWNFSYSQTTDEISLEKSEEKDGQFNIDNLNKDS